LYKGHLGTLLQKPFCQISAYTGATPSNKDTFIF
jgi:hypothetical protein